MLKSLDLVIDVIDDFHLPAIYHFLQSFDFQRITVFSDSSDRYIYNLDNNTYIEYHVPLCI